jgi:hypothetical protein
MAQTKLLMVEINEVTWDLIDPLIEQGKLPTFARLKREGTWAAPMSVDLKPHLDPWITWTTVYTGCPQKSHNVYFLEQPPETIHAPRVWEICQSHGLSVGVYGSLCSWPPKPVNGFHVPETFAQDAATYPESLQPIQELNLTYTRSIRLPADQDGLWFKAKLGGQLISLGLSARTMARVTRQLAHERINPEVRWRRVALQPIVNFDFFRRLYRRYRPRFATFHTNHVAHYMHTYWKAMRPEIFTLETPPDEKRIYGGAIEYGYRTADELLSRVLELMDHDTTLVVASSMGQKPFITGLQKGKRIRQIRSLDKVLELIGVDGQARPLHTMSDQFNVYPHTPEVGAFIIKALQSAYIDSPDRPMFYVEFVENAITATLRSYDETSEDSRCRFPHGENGKSIRYADLIYDTGMVKSGCHDPKGMMILYGQGIRRGGQIAGCDNLDIAPTLLTLLGLPVPAVMTGRVLSEAFSEKLLSQSQSARRLAKAV